MEAFIQDQPTTDQGSARHLGRGYVKMASTKCFQSKVLLISTAGALVVITV